MPAICGDYAFYAGAVCITIMLFITVFFYKEPPREIQGITLRSKIKEIGTTLADLKFTFFLIILGIFYWTPFWAFFNLMGVYINNNLDTGQLYLAMKSVLGQFVTNSLFASKGEDGVYRILGETISHTGLIIMLFQVFVSRVTEKTRPFRTFFTGIAIASVGFIFVGFAHIWAPTWVFLGTLFFAIGEMVSSPRIQEYITWLAPKEKAGLYMGSNFLALGLGGALSGLVYTPLFGIYEKSGNTGFIWFLVAAHCIVGIMIIHFYTKTGKQFKELED